MVEREEGRWAVLSLNASFFSLSSESSSLKLDARRFETKRENAAGRLDLRDDENHNWRGRKAKAGG